MARQTKDDDNNDINFGYNDKSSNIDIEGPIPKTDEDKAKSKRERFSRQLVPALDSTVAPSTTLIESVSVDLGITSLPLLTEEGHIKDTAQPQGDNEPFPIPQGPPPTLAISTGTMNATPNDGAAIDKLDYVELRPKPPQKPPRTFDSLLGSSQSIDSLSNLENSLKTPSISNLATDRISDSNLNSDISSEHNDVGRKTNIQPQNVSSRHDVQTNPYSPDGDPRAMSRDSSKIELSSTPGSVSCSPSSVLNNQSSSCEASSIGGLSENIIPDNDHHIVIGGGNNHIGNGVENALDIKHIKDGDRLKKHKKNKKHKKDKKHKKKESTELGEGNLPRVDQDSVSDTSKALVSTIRTTADHEKFDKPSSSDKITDILSADSNLENMSSPNVSIDAERGDQGNRSKSRWRGLKVILKVGKKIVRTKPEVNIKAKGQSPIPSIPSSCNVKCVNGSSKSNSDVQPNGCNHPQGKTVVQFCDCAQKCRSCKVSNTVNSSGPNTVSCDSTNHLTPLKNGIMEGIAQRAAE